MSRRLSLRCAAACLCLWSASDASWAADEPPSAAPSSAPPAVAPPPEPPAPQDTSPAAVSPTVADSHVGDPNVDAAVTRALGPRCAEAGPLLRQAALTASASDRALV